MAKPDYAFNPNTGQWIGFLNASSWVVMAYQYRVVNNVVQAWKGQGKQVQIARVGPDWEESADLAGNPISGSAHTTRISTYDSPDASGHHRDVLLTHFPLQTTAGVRGLRALPTMPWLRGLPVRDLRRSAG